MSLTEDLMDDNSPLGASDPIMTSSSPALNGGADLSDMLMDE